MRLSFVLTRAGTMLDPTSLLRAYARISPRERQPQLEVGDGMPDGVTLTFGDRAATIAHMPVPVPNGEADAAARFSISSFGTGWSLPPHQTHWMVVLRDPEPPAPLEALMLHSRVVACVTEASGAVGVYAGNAHATHDPRFYVDLVERERMPLPLWTGVSIASEGPGRISLLTLGMSQLEFPDVLLIAPSTSGNQALGFVFDLLWYVVGRRAPIGEGETVGRTAQEKLAVRYVASPIDPRQRVARVELP